MKHTVVWTIEAEQELAAIWLTAADRGLIAAAADFLDRQLAQSPAAVGESRPDGRRIAYQLPLGVGFEIIEDDCLVRVLSVWWCRHLDEQRE